MTKTNQPIHIAATPQFGGTQATPNSFVTNPATGTTEFGTFPGAKDSQSKRVFVAGPIRLRYGKQSGAHRGFGLVHWWQQRYPTETLADAEVLFFDFISKVLGSGAGIFYEGNLASSKERVAVVKNGHGTLILEERSGQQPFYSIVTGYRSFNAKGTKIGKF